MASKLGPIWNYFTLVRTYEVAGYRRPTKVSTCNICDKQFTQTDGATTNLRNHLRRVHAALFAKFEEENRPRIKVKGLPIPKPDPKPEPQEQEAEPEEPQASTSGLEDPEPKPCTSKQARAEEKKYLAKIQNSQAPKSLTKLSRSRSSIHNSGDPQADERKENAESIPPKGQQPKESKQKSAAKRKRTPNTQAAEIREIMWMLHHIGAGHSFDSIDLPMTQQLLQMVCPEMEGKLGDYLLANWIDVIHRNVHGAIREIAAMSLNAQDKIILSAGLYDGKKGNFMEVSLQFVDTSFQFQNVVLGIQQIRLAETAETLKDHLESILDTFFYLDLKSKIWVYDHSNYVLDSAIKSSRYASETCDCLIRRLDRVVRLGLEVTDDGKLLLMNAYQVTYFMHTDLSLKKHVQSLCRDLDVPFIMDPLSVAVEDALQNLLSFAQMQDVFSAFKETAEELGEYTHVTGTIPNRQQFKILEKLAPFLQRLNNFVTTLKKDDIITHRYLGEILNMKTAMLHEILELQEVEGEAAKQALQVAQGIQATFLKEFGESDSPDYAGLVQSFFHPTYKARIWFNADNISKYQDFLAKLINDEPSTIEWYKQHDQQEKFNIDSYCPENLKAIPECQKRIIEALALDRQKLLVVSKDYPPMQKEVNEYRMINVFEDDIDVLAWWRLHQNQFPNLARLAQRVLSSPVTAPTSIRSLNPTGVILWQDSNDTFVEDILHKLMFIQANYKRVPLDVNMWHNNPQENLNKTAMSFSELEDLDQIQTQQLMMMQDETQYLDPEIYAEQSMHEEDTSRDLFEDN